jgi:Protein of unknown function (DUF2568)
MITAANLTLRFLLELAAIGALGYWGFRTGSGPLTAVILGLGAPTVAMVVWGTFVAPKATVAVADPVRLLISLAVFGAAGLALHATRQDALVWVFACLVAVNVALLHGLGAGSVRGV